MVTWFIQNLREAATVLAVHWTVDSHDTADAYNGLFGYVVYIFKNKLKANF